MIYVFGNDITGPLHSPLSFCACGFVISQMMTLKNIHNMLT